MRREMAAFVLSALVTARAADTHAKTPTISWIPDAVGGERVWSIVGADLDGTETSTSLRPALTGTASDGTRILR